MTKRLFIRPGCSACDELKAGGIPDDVLVFDASTRDGMAEGAFWNVIVYPALVIDPDCDFPTVLTDPKEIRKAIEGGGGGR